MKNDNGERCPQCGEETLRYSMGIIKCSECGWWKLEKEAEKINEMKAVEYLRIKRRMLKAGVDISQNNEMDDAELAIKYAKKWDAEHPAKTILQDFLEKYPNAEMNSNGVPTICPSAIGFKDGCSGEVTDYCYHCWNRPLEG